MFLFFRAPIFELVMFYVLWLYGIVPGGGGNPKLFSANFWTHGTIALLTNL